MAAAAFDADVIVIGSGFGGAVAAKRFAEAGQRVLVLERGKRVSREDFEPDMDFFWRPHKNRYGFNEFRFRGRNLVPWVGAAVGGGSHVYAGTLKRRAELDGFPEAIRADGLDAHYARAETMLGATEYPDYPPYSDVRATQLLLEAGDRMTDEPDVVDHGPIKLGISFAPPDRTPGERFENDHGCVQRYYDPAEQSILGGDIGAKNSLDRNYLFVAETHGAEILPLTEVDRIEPMDAGGYRVSGLNHQPSTSLWRRFTRAWVPFCGKVEGTPVEYTARRVVVAAGAVGSTELLLRNRDVHHTLPELNHNLGARYTTNGDFISFLFPFRGIAVSWLGTICAIIGLVMGNWWLAGAGAVGYLLGLAMSRRPFDPDIGTTNSDYIRFGEPSGTSQRAYIESGRYPTPTRLLFAVVLSALGQWRPHKYRWVISFTNLLRRWVPPFAMLARTWPIPLLKMGDDRAFGVIRLNRKQRAVIDYDVAGNKQFYAELNRLGRRVAKHTGSFWAPNLLFYAFGVLEVPHNQGGVPMGDRPTDGVVDHAGRVFGHDDLIVLDGSIIPVSPRPNPALTITALAERAMDKILAQVEAGEPVRAETRSETANERS